jgi:DNA-binding response OmpR family regulator
MEMGTVLLIERDADRRGLLRRALERRGYRVAGEAGTVAEVIDAVAGMNAAPTTVLVGAGLDDGDVAPLARIIKRTWPQAQVIEEMGIAQGAPRRSRSRASSLLEAVGA